MPAYNALLVAQSRGAMAVPKIEISGKLFPVEDCPVCDRTVAAKFAIGVGFIAPCGRRLLNLSECGTREGVCIRNPE